MIPVGIQKDEGGFTLVEILTALVLLALVILPALSTTGSSLQVAARRTEVRQEAALLLRSVIADGRESKQGLVIDTLLSTGNRYRILNKPVVTAGDSLWILTVLMQQGAQWDTVLCSQTVTERALRVLSH